MDSRIGACRKFNSGFTLAEVLITLGIIGVVTALTLPALIQNYQKKSTVTQLKKAYSLLNQSAQLAVKDYGDIASWEYNQNVKPSELSMKDANIAFAEKYLVPYIKNIKTIENVSIASHLGYKDGIKILKALKI